MKKSIVSGALAAAFMSGCATTPTPELSDCLQPNRRVVVEVQGTPR